MNTQQIVERVKSNRRGVIAVVVALIVIVGILLFRGCSEDNVVPTPVNTSVPTQQASKPPIIVTEQPVTPHKLYVVQKGDFLRKIADANGVGWEAVLLLNEELLKCKYEEVCTKLVHKPKSLFCNDAYKRPYANTLSPGWELKIPTSVAPNGIAQAVAQIKGDRVALVIDDSGSIGNDRQVVSEWYLAAFRQSGKKIIGVWLYSDGFVRHYNDAAEIELRTVGSYENTYGALKTAALEKPDSIVLVTDEPGDDWGTWSGVNSLPPVIGHCLQDPMAHSCEANLKRLAAETHGQYVSGLSK